MWRQVESGWAALSCLHFSCLCRDVEIQVMAQPRGPTDQDLAQRMFSFLILNFELLSKYAALV